MSVAAARRIHLDALGGIAGDMFAAAMLDALPELEPRVFEDIAAVLPEGSGARLTRGTSGGVRVLRFGFANDTLPAANLDTSYRGLCQHIRSATLHHGTAEAALGILTGLARAEAHIHARPVDDVHFHELADWDSVMDMVAAGSIAAALLDTTWTVSDLPLGSGHVQTAHGRIPIPAPATAELLRGFRCRDDGVGGERVTPTGAAIVSYLVTADAPRTRTSGRLRAVGTGAGTRELPGMPNILRVLVFEPEPATIDDDVAVISFDVDDMTGEEIGVAAERLRAEPGVLDVSLGQRLGKKSRPLTSFRLLADPALREAIAQRCLAETTTIGLRWRLESRSTLVRHTTTVRTSDGTSVRVKHVVRPEGLTTRKAESDDLKDVAGLEYRRVRKTDAEDDSH